MFVLFCMLVTCREGRRLSKSHPHPQTVSEQEQRVYHHGQGRKSRHYRGSQWAERGQSAVICGAREDLEEVSRLAGRGTGECLGRRLSVWEGQEKQEASRGTEGSH